MATKAAGNVQPPKGSGDGVMGPFGQVAAGVLNLGDQFLAMVGPRVNGGQVSSKASPLAGAPAAQSSQNLPTEKPVSVLPLILGAAALLWLARGSL